MFRDVAAKCRNFHTFFATNFVTNNAKHLFQLHHPQEKEGSQKYRPFSNKCHLQLLNELTNNYYQAHLLSRSSPVSPLCPIIKAANLR